MLQRYDPELTEHPPRGVVRWVENRRVRATVRFAGGAPRAPDTPTWAVAVGRVLAKLPGAERHGVAWSAAHGFETGAGLFFFWAHGQDCSGDAEQLPSPTGHFEGCWPRPLFSHVLHPNRSWPKSSA